MRWSLLATSVLPRRISCSRRTAHPGRLDGLQRTCNVIVFPTPATFAFLVAMFAGSRGALTQTGRVAEEHRTSEVPSARSDHPLTYPDPIRRAETGANDGIPKEMGVYFVGNSYTMGGVGQPRLLKELLELRGTTLRTGMRILGGETLQGHLDVNLGRMPQWREVELLSLLKRAGKTDDQIRTRLAQERLPYAKGKGSLDASFSQGGPWDYVVLQVGRDRDEPARFGLPQALQEFTRKVRSMNLQTTLVLSVTWADQHAPELQPRIDESGRRLAQQHGLRMAPVGTALQRAHAGRPDLQIFVSGTDSHPGSDGAYLMACVLYATITSTSPELLPDPSIAPTASGPVSPPPHALGASRTKAATGFLRRLAWTTYLDSRRMLTQPPAPQEPVRSSAESSR